MSRTVVKNIENEDQSEFFEAPVRRSIGGSEVSY